MVAHVIVSHGPDHWPGEDGLSGHAKEAGKLSGFERLPGAPRYPAMRALMGRLALHQHWNA